MKNAENENIDCRNCEHYIFSECPGCLEPQYDNLICVSFLDNIYNCPSREKVMSEMETEYRNRQKSISELSDNEIKRQMLTGIINMDVHLYGTYSEFYPFWNFNRAVSTLEMLETYQRLNVQLTLKDFKGESFYAKDCAGVVNDLAKIGLAKRLDGTPVEPIDDLPPPNFGAIPQLTADDLRETKKILENLK